MMKEWETLCAAGNECFHQCRWTQAKRHYHSALLIVDALYSASPDNDSLMLAWLVTHHNLASLYKKTGETDEQINHLTTPFITLRDKLRTTPPSDKSYPTILHALTKCKFELTTNMQGEQPDDLSYEHNSVSSAKPGDTIH